MNKTIEKVRDTLMERLEKNIAEHSDCKLTPKFQTEISNTLDTVLELCDDDDMDEFATFSTLLELHIANDTIFQLNEFLKEFN